MRYQRSQIKGGTYFFTVNLSDRSSNLLIREIQLLRSVTKKVQQTHPFTIDAMVVLPDHLHTIWTLPAGDSSYSKRWSLIKSGFSREIPKIESIPSSRNNKRERNIWQRRFWEHQIRDERDFDNHVNYIHINPVKHGYSDCVRNWPYSSFHKYVRLGYYPRDWGTDIITIEKGYGEC